MGGEERVTKRRFLVYNMLNAPLPHSIFSIFSIPVATAYDSVKRDKPFLGSGMKYERRFLVLVSRICHGGLTLRGPVPLEISLWDSLKSLLSQ